MADEEDGARPPVGPEPGRTRAARAAEALRANLRKRKAQQRDRAAVEPGSAPPLPEVADEGGRG